MLLTKDLIKDARVTEELIPMLKEVDIPDFVKCIATFSKLPFDRIDDGVIQDYLITWAKNKYKYYKLLGNKLRVDTKIEYKTETCDRKEEIEVLQKQFPIYAPWLQGIEEAKNNELNWHNLSSNFISMLDFFPETKNGFDKGMHITSFFQRCLEAPAELVTKIAGLFELDKIDSNFTISIDPVDIMLASVTPYDWSSCYGLECGGHADGCMAALLDTASIVTYIWDKEGKYSLDKKYDLKKIRFKKMRQWVAFSDDMKAIHFNKLYPSNDRCREELLQKIRLITEKRVSEYLGIEDIWTCYTRLDKEARKKIDVGRMYGYGYSEFDKEYVYVHRALAKELEDPDNETKVKITPYDVDYKCACGCGTILPCSDACEEEVDFGDGFNCESVIRKFYCELADCYCELADDICEGNCGSCCYWEDAHPYCEYKDGECEDPEIESCDGEAQFYEDICCECPHYKEHIKAMKAEKEEEDRQEEDI